MVDFNRHRFATGPKTRSRKDRTISISWSALYQTTVKYSHLFIWIKYSFVGNFTWLIAKYIYVSGNMFFSPSALIFMGEQKKKKKKKTDNTDTCADHNSVKYCHRKMNFGAICLFWPVVWHDSQYLLIISHLYGHHLSYRPWFPRSVKFR